MRFSFSAPLLNRTAKPVALAVAYLCASGMSAWAQSPVEPSSQGVLKLKPSLLLREDLTPEQRKNQPTFVFGNRISGRSEIETVIDGNAELRRNGLTLRADRIEYYQPTDLAKARGKVYINRDGNVYEGTEAEIKVDAQEGFFLQPRYQLLRNGGNGQASRIDFLDDKRSVARDSTYTTHPRDPEGKERPDWILRAAQVRFDNDTNVGEATDSRFEFMGVTLMSAPVLSFPLSDERKSGWLPAGINLDNVSGLELVAPYYINLAPNRDATLYPGIMSRRGANLGTEFRYLEKDYRGTVRWDWMPADRLRNATRWGISTTHSGSLATGWSQLGSVGLSLALNRVSDDDYWRDFPRASGSLTQRLLPSDGVLTWSRGPWSLLTRSLKWQTLQQTGSIITPPNDRLPQLNGRYSRVNDRGFDYSIELDTTRFRSERTLTLQPNAQRSYALAQVSRPVLTAGGFFVPKLQLHNTNYSFDAPLTAGPLLGQRSATRIVPTVSLDSGLIFERNATYSGRGFTQTLEPRALFTYTPYRDQSSIPIYDSGSTDYNFATVFAENAFTGNDRISDNKLLTLGLTSRLLDPSTGAEIVRLSYAQRLRFADQRVTLPGGVPDTTRFSDMLFGGTVNWNPQWQLDGTVQYSPNLNRSQRTTLGARYTPSNYRVLSAAYRNNRGVSEQMDFGWQWPLNDFWGDKGKDLGAGQGQGRGRWYSVGRMNFSFRDKRLVDTLVGLEYDGGSWLSRVVIERLQTTNTSANKRILFQLEFVGFARVGSNPLSSLKNNVPRYQLLREKIETSPSRFSNYE